MPKLNIFSIIKNILHLKKNVPVAKNAENKFTVEISYKLCTHIYIYIYMP